MMFWRVHLCLEAIISFRATQLKCLEVKLTTVESCLEMSSTSGTWASYFLMLAAAVSMLRAFSRKPYLPCFIIAAHVPAMTAPDLDPAMVGVTYIPPDQVVTALNVNLLSSLVLNIRHEKPFGPKQYLCGSLDIEVTPGTLKSYRNGILKPASSVKGNT